MSHIFCSFKFSQSNDCYWHKCRILKCCLGKNEWSRYLAIMKKDRNKLLLPCYKEMDPYDMPEALSILQSYDVSKIGFIQDLIRGIKKVVNTSSEEINNEKNSYSIK